LDCTSCHQTDNTDRKVAEGLPSAIQRPRNAGAYMLPIVYEQHCQACHPLTFDRKVADKPETGLHAVRHRLQPDEIRQFLKGLYTANYLENNRSQFERPAASRQMPGKQDTSATQQALEFIENQIRVAERQLFLGKKTCKECHYYENETTGI